MLTDSEQAVLNVFRKFRIAKGEMLCFHGPDLVKHKPALTQLSSKDLLRAETFNGGYTLTATGFTAMKQLAPAPIAAAAKSAKGLSAKSAPAAKAAQKSAK